MRNQVVSVVDAFLGDSGKGRVIDDLPFILPKEEAKQFLVFYRPGGGSNTGHTVFIGDKKYVFHMLPSGVLIPNSEGLIGRAALIDVPSIIKELEMISELNTHHNIKLDYGAHVTMPWHIVLDKLREEIYVKAKIGTTGKGIGPTIESRDKRMGFVTVEMLKDQETLKSRIESAIEVIEPELNELMAKYEALNLPKSGVIPFLESNKLADDTPLSTFFRNRQINQEAVLNTYLAYGKNLLGKVKINDTQGIAQEHVKKGNRILVEGTQGALLDPTHGTYPYVTVGLTTRAGLEHDAGIFFDLCISVVKAYATRVGNGPFPTEIKDEALASKLREAGKEYGASTGRPRRVGWLDGVALEYAMDLNYRKGEDRVIALTKLDVLEGFESLICRDYKISEGPSGSYTKGLTGRYIPQEVYRALIGASSRFNKIDSIKDVNRYDNLPEAAKFYIEAIEEISDAKVLFIGKGPARGQVILR